MLFARWWLERDGSMLELGRGRDWDGGESGYRPWFGGRGGWGGLTLALKKSARPFLFMALLCLHAKAIDFLRHGTV